MEGMRWLCLCHVGIDGDSTKLVLWIFLLLAAYSENIAFSGNL